MNPEIKSKWVAALRSDKYKQCKGQLRAGDAFCCLGVLCDIHRRVVGGRRWLDGKYAGESFCLPDEVMEWAELKDRNPILPGKTTLGSENDAGVSFPQIADLIEKHL